MSPSSDLDAAGERIERLSPGYLHQVRRAAAKLSVSPTAGGRLADALDLVEEMATIDPDAHVTSTGFIGRLVQRIVKRLVRWYVLQISSQVTDFSHAVTWLGLALRDYVDEVEREVDDLRSEVASLRARLVDPGPPNAH